MSRRILLIIAFILAVIGIAVMIYVVFIKDIVSPRNENNGNANNVNGLPISNDITNRIIANNVNGLPVTNITNEVPQVNVNATPDTIARGGRTLTTEITDSQTGTPQLTADGSSLTYYDALRGKFYRITPDGTKVELTDKTFPEATDVQWSPTQNEAIISFPDQSKILYNFDTKAQVTLPKEWDGVTFAPEGNQVAYKYLTDDPDSRWLAIANPDGSNVRGIETIGDKENDVQVSWSPNNQVVALYHESSSASSEEVFPIGLNGENFKSFKTDGRGFDGKWSPNGNQLIYTTYSSATNYNPSLTIVDANPDTIGSNKQSLNIQTWVDKCAFGGTGSTVYCAVPQNLPEGSGIYRELAKGVPDTLWKIDLKTGLKTRIATPVSQSGSFVSAQNVVVSQDERYLYFVDSNTGRLHRIQLK